MYEFPRAVLVPLPARLGETDWSASLLDGDVREFVQVTLSAADLPVVLAVCRMTVVTQIWVRGKRPLTEHSPVRADWLVPAFVMRATVRIFLVQLHGAMSPLRGRAMRDRWC